jgi:hypothetical protein
MIKLTNVRTLGQAATVLRSQLGVSIALAQQKMAADLWAKITYRTPVDTGRAQSSWNLAQGAPDPAIPPEAKKGERIPTPPMPSVAAIDGTKTVYVTSNLHYVPYLEDGTSKQAPVHMVQMAVAEVLAEAQLSAEGRRR